MKYALIVELMIMNRKQVAKVPYDGTTLPESSKLGGKFIDFNKILRPIKKIKIKRRKKIDTK